MLLSRSLLLLLTPSAWAGDVSVFLGPSGGVGIVQVGDEQNLTPPRFPAELQGIQLLPIDFAGRTDFEALSFTRPRQRSDVPGATRVALPLGRGSLYRYRRDAAGLPTNFGYALVGADGAARSVWETLGSGPQGNADPLAAPIAVSTDGTTLLVVTALAAGGDLFEIDLASGAAELRTSALPPQAFVDGGLALLDGFGAASTTSGLLRFDRVPLAQASFVSMPAAPIWFGGRIVWSADGLVGATIAGASASSADVLAFTSSGAAVLVTTERADLSGIGSAAEIVSGPFLALSTDGSHCAWRSEGLTREAWVRAVPLPAAFPSEQITSDLRFADTLDTTGEFVFGAPARLILLVGELAAPQGIGSADVFQVDVSTTTGQLTFANVTLTSGDAAVPFLSKGVLTNEGGLHLLPAGNGAVCHNQLSGGSGELLTFTWALSGVQTHATQVKALDWVEVVGADLALVVRREAGNGSRDLLRLPLSLAAPISTLVSLPEDHEFVRQAVSASGWLAAVVTSPSGEYVGRVHAPSGLAELIFPLPFVYGPTLSITPLDGVALSIPVPAGWSYFGAWGSVVPTKKIPTGFQPGFVLPR
jgi:hypothetical protein